MRVSTRGRYALRFMIDVARHASEGMVSLKTVSQREKISEKYLEQIVGLLNKKGLLRSARGAQGGYALAKDAARYTVYEILLATEDDLSPVPCLLPYTECPMHDSCSTVAMWKGLQKVIRDYLRHITLEQLASKENRDGSIEEAIKLSDAVQIAACITQ